MAMASMWRKYVIAEPQNMVAICLVEPKKGAKNAPFLVDY